MKEILLAREDGFGKGQTLSCKGKDRRRMPHKRVLPGRMTLPNDDSPPKQDRAAEDDEGNEQVYGHHGGKDVKSWSGLCMFSF